MRASGTQVALVWALNGSRAAEAFPWPHQDYRVKNKARSACRPGDLGESYVIPFNGNGLTGRSGRENDHQITRRVGPLRNPVVNEFTHACAIMLGGKGGHQYVNVSAPVI